MITVNKVPVHDEAIVTEMQYHLASTHTEAKNRAAESLIINELLRQRADELGLLQNDAADLSACVDALIEQEVSVPTASDQDARTYFENNRDKFASSPLVFARHILLAVSPEDAKGRSEARELANNLITQLQSNAHLFSAMAEEYSDCPSAKTGGELGQLGKGQTVPEFERQLFNATEGLIASPIESRYGIHIVYLDKLEPGKPLPYEAVYTRIRDYLNDKVRRKAIAQYISTLIAGASITGFDFDVQASPLMQ